MTILTTIFTSITSTFRTNGPTGADAIRTAVNEIENLRSQEFSATLSEPDIVEGTARFFSDPKVVVPIKDAPFESVNRLVFDLPQGRNDTRSTFMDMLESFDLDLESMEQLENEDVPMVYVGGNASVLWDEVTDDTEKGGEVDPEEESDDTGVTVEETTISGDGDV